MSLIWFIIKGYIFGMLYSGFIAVALVPAMPIAMAATPKPAQSPSIESSEPNQKNPLMTAIIITLVLALCSTQGAIVAAAVKLSLSARPDAWWPLWYAFGFGAAIPLALGSRGDSDEGEFGKLVGFVGATGGYILVCVWPTAMPNLLLRASMVLAV
ncbi:MULTISPECIES: hypothetical protein [unclassified Corallococcus]|uniref:hypothetical protein n=1 Tax=unclassified Corallococcus TaxID=2685029 RepID=UPI001A8E50E8|nr:MULTISPECIES: hypothetical protein [unclassified Corallococcus]MBN9685987.1 hypothetical protein [Corallococcus sp. NCSPR001]WAS82574.1 hypothetical protein O0N60_24990 [Corallococcus sp. NCRR]